MKFFGIKLLPVKFYGCYLKVQFGECDTVTFRFVDVSKKKNYIVVEFVVKLVQQFEIQFLDVYILNPPLLALSMGR